MGVRLVSEGFSSTSAGDRIRGQFLSFEGPLHCLAPLPEARARHPAIPVSFVTEKYLEYLAVMQLMHLDIASEYLVMAATLAHIKSKMLLPAPPPGQEDDAFEEEEDPRETLIRRLLEYQKYKQAAADLAARGVAGRDVFLRGSTDRGVGQDRARAAGRGPPLRDRRGVPASSLSQQGQALARRRGRSHQHQRPHRRADRAHQRRRALFKELPGDDVPVRPRHHLPGPPRDDTPAAHDP